MSFRYIGSKSRIVDQIKNRIGPSTGGFFVDAFCGTGVVAEAAAELGWPVRINDNLSSAVISAGARLISSKEATFKKLGGYAKVLDQLNQTEAIEGFIWRSYSPASFEACGIERRYFTENNAGRIDAMRALIREWAETGLIGEVEERLLIADLFGALNRVANIAGTFGCFLSKWTPQANAIIAMRPRELKAISTKVEASVGDVFDVRADADDIVYLDPPYTKRQYASYYHILETVALGDEPIVQGVAGLRPWRDRASDFCYKTRALSTLTRLIGGIEAKRVLLSYSSEGHIAIKDLKSSLSKLGASTMHPLGSIGRYRPNKAASDGAAEVKEYLVVVTRDSKTNNKRVAAPALAEAFA
jgi:adenine-specific DNA-methyltransferase